MNAHCLSLTDKQLSQQETPEMQSSTLYRKRMALQIINKKIPKKKQRAKNKRKVPIVIDMTDDLDLEDLQEREKFDCQYKNYPLIQHIKSNGDNSIRTVKAIPEVKQLKNYSYLTTDIDPSCIDTNQPHTENKSLLEEKMHGQRRSPRQIS